MLAKPLQALVLTSCMVAALLSTAPARAQFFYETPKKPAVETDLSVLDAAQAPDVSEMSPIQTAPTQQTEVEKIPLAPPPPAAPRISPYAQSRIVERIELDGSNPYPGPYVGTTPPSPFSPPAVIKPPAPAPELPRTAPAPVIKPKAASDAPIIIQ